MASPGAVSSQHQDSPPRLGGALQYLRTTSLWIGGAGPHARTRPAHSSRVISEIHFPRSIIDNRSADRVVGPRA